MCGLDLNHHSLSPNYLSRSLFPLLDQNRFPIVQGKIHSRPMGCVKSHNDKWQPGPESYLASSRT